jgi:ATP-dependent exoDNAse (exonuclease V) alpha subunit
MPDADGPWWQASLLYTAVTRARQRAIVVADPARLPAALAHWPTRLSGLATGWE